MKFEQGKKYICFSPCNTGCTWVFRVDKITAKTLTLLGDFPNGVNKKRVKIYTDSNSMAAEQYCKPLGNYSFAPTLFAKNIVK